MEDKEPDLDLFGTNAPYWQRHYGIGHPWRAPARARRGCVFLAAAVLAVIVLVLVIGLVSAIAG